MCIDFDGHHSGGSSFDSVIRCGPYSQAPVRFKKKKKQVKSPSPESRVPKIGSYPPIGSSRESGRDSTYSYSCIILETGTRCNQILLNIEFLS